MIEEHSHRLPPGWQLLFPAAIVCAVCLTTQAHASTNVLSRSDITKEPPYQSTPKYCLLSLGTNGDVKVWMVEDGKRLFIDRNANGDLTDDGPPVEPVEVRQLSAKQWDFKYVLDAITPTNGSRHTHFELWRWNYGEANDSYGLSLSVEDRLPLYAGWFGTFWSTNREKAPVIHFGEPFTPRLLRRKEFVIGGPRDRLSIGFMNRGSDDGAEARVSIEAIPRLLVPTLSIKWPTVAGTSPLRTYHRLTERCCYWEFYTTDFEVPKGVVAGQAKVSVEFPTGTAPLGLTTTEFTVPVVGGSQ